MVEPVKYVPCPYCGKPVEAREGAVVCHMACLEKYVQDKHKKGG